MSGTTGTTGGRPKAGLEVSSKGVPVNWNGEHWDYSGALISLSKEDDLEGIANGKAKPPDPSTSDEDKTE